MVWNEKSVGALGPIALAPFTEATCVGGSDGSKTFFGRGRDGIGVDRFTDFNLLSRIPMSTSEMTGGLLSTGPCAVEEFRVPLPDCALEGDCA